jgi:hypothetical protein
LGGFTEIGAPAPTVGPIEPFVDSVNIDTRGVWDMLAALSYVPSAGELKQDELALKTAAVSDVSVARTENSNQPIQPKNDALQGGMINVASVSLVGPPRAEAETASIDIDELLRVPAQMDGSTGKYQAFETATDEEASLTNEHRFESTSMLPRVEAKDLPQKTAEPTAESVVPAHAESSAMRKALVGEDDSDVPATITVGDSTSRVLHVAAAAAVVILGPHMTRLRYDASQLETWRALETPGTSDPQNKRHWYSRAYQRLSRLTTRLFGSRKLS